MRRRSQTSFDGRSAIGPRPWPEARFARLLDQREARNQKEIYISGELGFRLEDDIVITPAGPRG